MELVIKYEVQQGRHPVDVSRKGCGYDIESSGRCIEVKGTGKKQLKDISLYKKLLEQLGEKKKDYYIYFISNIQGDAPELRIISPDYLKNLEEDTRFVLKAKFYRKVSPIDDINF